MAALATMPALSIPSSDLAKFGATWKNNGGSLSRTPPYSSGELGKVFDNAVGVALATLLGGIPVVSPHGTSLLPPQADCVEVGTTRVIGGVRPQNFDVCYRPDGVRLAYDTKTLNDQNSVGKNWQNMVNDLATEATTVHSRFPHAVVAFIVAIPSLCVTGARLRAIVETLERLGRRVGVEDPVYMAEAISLVLWDPDNGAIIPDAPPVGSPLRAERFSEQVQLAYVNRYKGLPPHAE